MEIIYPILFLSIPVAILLAVCFIIIYIIRSSLRRGKAASGRFQKLLMWLIASLVSAAAGWGLGALLSSPLFAIPKSASYFCYAATAALSMLWLFIIFGQLKHKSAQILLAIFSISVFAVAGVFLAGEIADDALPVLAESSNLLYDYDPLNAENKLAALYEPSTLTITDNIPRLDGATALYPIYAAFANEVYPRSALEWPDDYDPWLDFEKDTPITALECSTTTGAYKRLVDGEADIIFVAGPSEEQLQYAENNGEEMIFTPIGREAFVFFVNAENPIESLTVDQIRGIYSGGITKWKDLGASLGKIRAFQRNTGSGSQSTMIRFMGDTELMEPPQEEVIGGMLDIITEVSDYKNHKNAIGYSFRFYSTKMVQNNQIRLLQIDGVAPTKENILNGAYPVASEFYAVYLASNDNPNVQPLIDWILSEQGQSLIDQSGYVALN